MYFQTWKQRIFIAFSSAFEYYNIAIYFVLQTYIAHHFFSDTHLGENALILVWLPYILRFMAMPFGSICIGYLAEKYGRKAALVCSSWITGIATLCMACLPTFDTIGYWATLLIFVSQIMQSFSYGGEFPTAIVFLMESSQAKERIRTCSMLVTFNILIVSLGFMVTGLCEWLLSEQQMYDFGWRIPIFMGALNILVGYIIRSKFIQSSPVEPKPSNNMNLMTLVKLVCLFAPNTILFFMHTMASKLLVSKLTSDSMLQTALPIAITICSALACLAAGYVLDRVQHTSTILKRTYIAMFFLAVPVFYLQTVGSWPILILSEMLMLLVFGISMALTGVHLYDKVGHNHKIISMGLSITISSSIFGSTMPLIVNYLNQFGHTYVGLFLSFGSLLYFVFLAIDQFQSRQRTSAMVEA